MAEFKVALKAIIQKNALNKNHTPIRPRQFLPYFFAIIFFRCLIVFDFVIFTSLLSKYNHNNPK